jgi:hypothetical protein
MLLIAGASVEPVGAQGDNCKADVFTASGRAKFRPFSKSKELEGGGAAMADAVANWQREVSAKVGERWRHWTEARDKSVKCEPVGTGKLISGNRIGCTISGRPCARGEETIPTPPPGSKIMVEDLPEDGKGKRYARYRDRYKDRERFRPYRSAETIHEEWSYKREMARQDRLAAWRHRRERRQYEREMQRQKYLEARRARAEAAGWRYLERRLRREAERQRRIERWLDRQAAYRDRYRDWDY